MVVNQPSGRKQDTISWCISSSWDVFWPTTRLSIDSNLVSILVCYPILDDAVSTCLIHDTWGLLMGVCSVMVLQLVPHGAMTKPKASCGTRHKVVLLGTRMYQRLLVMIHYEATPMCYLLVNLFLGYRSLSCQKISTSNQEISLFWDWNLDSWLQPLHHAYIIRQQLSDVINAYWFHLLVGVSSALL
jgi:hypothetical protein